MSFSFGINEREYAEDAISIYNKEPGFLKRRLKNKIHGSISEAKNCKRLDVDISVSKKFLKALKQKVGRNAHEKHIPTEILLNANLDLCKEFLNGLWRGDGTGSWMSEGKYVTSSERLAHEVRMLLARLGVYSAVSSHIQKAGYGKGKVIFNVNVTHAKNVIT